MKKILISIFICFCSIITNAQTIEIQVDIEDDFLKIPLRHVKVSILSPDSIQIVDSLKSISLEDGNGKLQKEIYYTTIKKEEKGYLMHATLSGYEEVWQSISIGNKDESIIVPTIKMRKSLTANLDEVVISASKVKMYYKGDTIVYNADAFNLPDGSMLDALIKQLPGVTMNEHGQIFVNGRLVEELLLGSRTFFGGNKRILMENLPYFTVKDLKVYEKQTTRSEALGYDVDPRSYVMDVNLKQEYNRGYIANMEVAGGTEERWLTRGFLLGFTDRWRYALMGNANNVNESGHIGERGHWTPASMPQSLVATRSIATDLDYLSKDRNWSDNINASFTSTDMNTEIHQRREQFLAGSKPVSITTNSHESNNWHLDVTNTFETKKPFYLRSVTSFNYNKRDGNGGSLFEQWDDLLTASMRNDALNKGNSWNLAEEFQGALNLKKEKEIYLVYALFFRHSDEQSWNSQRYDTWQNVTQANNVQLNANDVSNKSTNLTLLTSSTINNLFGREINLSMSLESQYSNQKAHDYLYHPDTLLLASQLDMLNAITDPSNSYDSHFSRWNNKVGISLIRRGSYHISPNNPLIINYDRWRIGIDVPIIHQSLDYKRSVIDISTDDTRILVSPNASFRYVSPSGKKDFRIHADHQSNPTELINQVEYRDDSQPLVVKLGNQNLKSVSTTSISVDYTDRTGNRQQQWHVGTSFNYRHRDVAQSVSYNQETGVYAYKPMNVSGAYTATTKLDYSHTIDEQRHWTWQMNAKADYNHSIDHTMFEGETESHENEVNTLTMSDNTYIQYQKGDLNIRATGDIAWRHSEGRMRDFKTLNALDYQYGLSARYTLPNIKTTLTADGTMYCRRGYGSSMLNTDDFVVNASVSQPFLKGKLIARLEAFDLLHNLSPTQYEVNAQGRTETWYRSLPHYAMLHLVYHWNKNPKKK